MFGLGYVGAEDRLFFMDVLRHAGRGRAVELRRRRRTRRWTPNVGGRALHRGRPRAPGRRPAEVPRPAGRSRSSRDAENYLAGVNQYILEAKLDPTKLPGEYAAIGARGPEPFKPADIIATASMVGGIFGKGGGKELEFSQLADALEARFGKRDGRARLQGLPRRRGRRGARDRVRAALPVPGAAEAADGRRPPRPGHAEAQRQPATTGALLPRHSRCAPRTRCWCAAPNRESGHPLMVAGPQVCYFNPQILMEQGVHAPATADGPGIDAQGASFVGINLYVQLGRGRDYAWSATSAGQDIIDTFALELCDDTHYRFRGRCEPIEVLEKTNRWLPNLGRPDPPGSQTAARRAHQARARRRARQGARQAGDLHQAALDLLPRGRQRRRLHGLQHARGGASDTASFQRAAAKIGYTFNWFYADAEHIAYFNSGLNPVRADDVNHDFPVAAKYEWQRLEPGHLAGALHRASTRTRRPSTRPTSSTGTTSRPRPTAPPTTTPTPPRIAPCCSRTASSRGSRATKKVTLPQLIDAMEVAGTDDLRAHVDLPLALKVIGTPARPGAARRGRQAARLARATAASGATTTATASTSTRTRSGSWTRGGRAGSRRSSSRRSAPTRSRR